MAALTCSRCQETKESLDREPVGGTLGQTILRQICRDCWREWTETSARLINHYGLNLGLPEHRQKLRETMKEFLNLAAGDTAS